MVHVGIESQALSEQKSFLKGKGKKDGVLERKEKTAKFTSRETTFDPLRNLALVPVFFAPGTRETFSPGW